jgi:predicted helicase
MPDPSLSEYLRRLHRDLTAGDATERTHYGSLRALVEALGAGISARYELRRIECGAPDFHVQRGDLLVGHIEAKDIGLSLDEAERSEQLAVRYLPTLPNLILTDFLEFRWYVDGEVQRAARLGRLSGGKITASSSGQANVEALLRDFLARDPQGAANAKDLALRLARLARLIHDVIIEAFRRGTASANLCDLLTAMQKALIPDLSPHQFADMFAQTLAYGFFAARCNHPLGQPFRRLGAAAEIPKTNPLLRQLFEVITGTALDEEPFVGYADDLVQLLDRTDMGAVLQDFGRHTGRADPVVHFYETFLQAFDPAVRELRGVYYTPEPVVSYMVRSVDHLLRTRFGCSQGLADTAAVERAQKLPDGTTQRIATPRVLILDPACGTGTFPYAVIEHIREQFRVQRNAGAWSSYVRDHLLPRIFGFELLMAPYAVAHLKLGMQLAGQTEQNGQRLVYDFSGGERLGVYLTNTLEEAAQRAVSLFGPWRVITDEANAAAEVKRDKPIMVVIGNPPYSGHSANRSWETKGGKRVPTFIGRLLQDYYRVDGQPLGERNPKWLQDDYVKFIRFGQWRIEASGEGVLALITNHSYLDNPTFRGMRQQLMSAFSDIYVLDLHGNSKKKERAPGGGEDKNVFDIQQGVAITLFVKERKAEGSARVWHADLWGARERKYDALLAASVETIDWRRLEPASSAYLFVPQDAAMLPEYQKASIVTSIFDTYASTVTTARNHFTVAFHPETLRERVADLRDQSLDDVVVRERYGLRDVSYWSLHEARLALEDCTDIGECVRPYCYRPFDFRFVFYHPAVCERMRPEVMAHMRAGNIALLTHRPQSPGDFTFAYCTRLIGDQCVAANKSVGGGNSFQFPLYLYPDADRKAISRSQRIEELKGAARGEADLEAHEALADLVTSLFPEDEYPRWPNLDPWFLDEVRRRLGLEFIADGAGDLTTTFGPDDVFGCIYAILHCPTYRTRYAEFLKRDFPRIPLTSDRTLFAALVAKGRDLVALHAMESPLLDELTTGFPVTGTNTVERVQYSPNEERVFINKTQYFDNVPRPVWDFHVGGYQVCQKWLRDRKGRQLSYDDIEHYQRIVRALGETIRLMSEIDALIPAWPIE